MAHVNRQSVCSVELALWVDSWQRVSAGVVRRAAYALNREARLLVMPREAGEEVVERGQVQGLLELDGGAAGRPTRWRGKGCRRAPAAQGPRRRRSGAAHRLLSGCRAAGAGAEQHLTAKLHSV